MGSDHDGGVHAVETESGDPPRILVVEDDPSLGASVAELLERESFRVVLATNAVDASAASARFRPDLALVDVGLPGEEDGFELARSLLGASPIPIVFVTAADDLADRLRGFDVGADDYLVKPFALPELLARIRVILRRCGRLRSSTIEVRDLVIDEGSRTVVRRGEEVRLTPIQFDLLVVLARSAGTTFSKRQLLGLVWGFGELDMVELLSGALLSGVRRLHGSRLVAAVVGAVGLAAAIGFVDEATGSGLTFGAFYLVPVVLLVPLAGLRWGMFVALASAAIWVLADRRIGDDDPSLLLDAGNTALRFSILAFVVALLSALQDALGQARGSDARSREFLGYAAHQLRTPTASVGVVSQALLAKGAAPDDEDALVRLAAESSRIGRLVTSILRFIRLDQGDPMPRHPVDLVDVATSATERLADLAAPVELDFVAPAADHVVVRANREAIEEALGNVIENAYRHAHRRVVVTVEIASGSGEVAVVDDGPGLPAGAEERAFEPFVTLDGGGGSGLGLAIARRLAEANDGSLHYRAGTFVLGLPMTRGPHRERSNPRDPPT